MTISHKALTQGLIIIIASLSVAATSAYAAESSTERQTKAVPITTIPTTTIPNDKNPPSQMGTSQAMPTSTMMGAPIDKPNMKDDALINWATEAAKSVYSYDFKNYPQQIKMDQIYFTDAGWKAFMEALNKSNNLKVVEDKKLVASATPNGKVTIIEQGSKNGVYTWKVQLPMTTTYESESKLIKQNLIITLLISRTKTPTGVGISHFIAEVAPQTAQATLPPNPATISPPLYPNTTQTPSTQGNIPPSSTPTSPVTPDTPTAPSDNIRVPSTNPNSLPPINQPNPTAPAPVQNY